MIKKEEYNEFSCSFLEGEDRGDDANMLEPEIVADDGYYGFASAIWKYMKINEPGPSAHSCITGAFKPNMSDRSAGHTGGFGTAINVLSKENCGDWVQKEGATILAEKYKDNLRALGAGLGEDNWSLTC